MILFDKSLDLQLDNWVKAYLEKCNSGRIRSTTKSSSPSKLPKSSVYLLIGCWQQQTNDDDLFVVRAVLCSDASDIVEVCVFANECSSQVCRIIRHRRQWTPNGSAIMRVDCYEHCPADSTLSVSYRNSFCNGNSLGICLIGVDDRDTRSMLIRALCLIGAAASTASSTALNCPHSTNNRMVCFIRFLI